MNKLTKIAKLLLLIILLGLFSCENGDVSDDENSSINTRANGYPIILVHGFNGWGRNEWIMDDPRGGRLKVLHMGGCTDVQEELKAKGFETHTADLGPFSSNWDRACELYAQIMNNEYVDYGKAHSEKHGHARFVLNKQYDDPSVDEDRYTMKLSRPWNKENKVHLVAHSMGVSTCRILIHLLEHGDPDEMSTNHSGEEPISPLFDAAQDTKDMVKSLVSIAGIINGTTLANSIKTYGDWMTQEMNFNDVVFNIDETQQEYLDETGFSGENFQSMTMEKTAILFLSGITYWIGTAALNETGISFYDFQMEQWGIAPKTYENGIPKESYKDYIKRVFQDDNPVWESRDICVPDLTPEGMILLNEKVKAEPNVYYFSYTTKQTRNMKGLFGGNLIFHRANDKMTILLRLFAFFMGTYSFPLNFDAMSPVVGVNPDYDTNDEEDGVPGLVGNMTRFERHWYPNDGVVNTYGQKYPMINSTNKCEVYDSSLSENSPQTFSTYDPDVDDSDSHQSFDKCNTVATELRPGTWYFMGQLDSDHWDIIGLGFQIQKTFNWSKFRWEYEYGQYYASPYHKDEKYHKSEALIKFYADLANFLNHLPDNED